MSTQEKVAKVNELTKSGMPKMEALKKVGIPYGTYYSAGRSAKKTARKYTKRTLKEKMFSIPAPESNGVITMNVRDFSAFVRELVKHG